MSAAFYILRFESSGLYLAAPRDLGRRWREHREGRACRTTRVDPPVELVCSEEFGSFSAAREREAQVKGRTRAKKEALASGDIQTLKNLSKRRRS